MIDFNKPVQTRDGRKVRILCTDANGQFPIVGLILGCEFDKPETWGVTGHCYETSATDKDDLINVPERVEQWVNIYEYLEAGCWHETRAIADRQPNATHRRGVLRVTYEDGKPVAVALEAA